MDPSLYYQNTPRDFWRCLSPISDTIWEQAFHQAIPMVGLPFAPENTTHMLNMSLGEGLFGDNHWQLSLAKRMYYLVKPLIPRYLSKELRRWYGQPGRTDFPLQFPIEPRFTYFLWEIMRQVLLNSNLQEIPIIPFWPNGQSFALALTHDIETEEGQRFVNNVADLEEKMGFRSSFNFVPERYPLDFELIADLKRRGFEVGVHGLKHDGKLFSSKSRFDKRAKRINEYLGKLDAVGFRSPLTHRQPEWMQALNIEYDSSFFDTDPFEPIPGGTMSIYPFFIGHFVELPYTLMQDYTMRILGETTPQKWTEKVDFIEKYSGMALINTHPDYLLHETTWNIYTQFLSDVKRRTPWCALPRDVAHWWRYRSTQPEASSAEPNTTARVVLSGESISIQNRQ